MTNDVFLDTSYAIALSSPNDRHHAKAQSLAARLDASATRLVTTRAVLLEIGNALSKQRFRRTALMLLQWIEADPKIEIVPLTEQLYADALKLFRERPDKDWGLVDCVSYIVMQQRGMSEVLTADEHFEQMGFRALLREPD